MNDIVLRVPADPAYLHLLRSVAAAVGARADLSVDEIEDLRIAIDEASAYVMAASDGDVQLEVGMKQGGIEAVVSGGTATANWPPAGGEDSLAWKVLSGLTDEAEFFQSDGRPAVRFFKNADVLK